ncbi:MAG: M28 family peptidase [Chitinophagales bacterium]
MKYFKLTVFLSFTCLLFAACEGCKNGGEQKKTVLADTAGVNPENVPVFNEDSAYAYIAGQVAFGPRVPGSAAQVACAKWIESKLKPFCDTVYKQEVQVTGGDGKSLPCINLIGAINPAAKRRILFLTHWDSRSWADQDTKDKNKPVLAADDGGSGVGVLLEMARVLKMHGLPSSLGIDILFTDVEDYGKSEWGDNSYCLGTQYWAHHPHIQGYKAGFGVLLDMVGARNAQFPLEQFSTINAGDVQQKVWQAANNAGYSSYFPYVVSAEITDDHVPVNKITGIKTIDIINLTQNPEQPFAAHWHTHADVMGIIDKNTLKAVGQTLLQTIYEQAHATAPAQ